MNCLGLSTARRYAVVTQLLLVVPLLLRGAGLNPDQRADPRPFVERWSPAQAKPAARGRGSTYVHFYLFSVVLWLRIAGSVRTSALPVPESVRSSPMVRQVGGACVGGEFKSRPHLFFSTFLFLPRFWLKMMVYTTAQCLTYTYVPVLRIRVETKASDGDETLHFIFSKSACHDADDGEKSGPFFFFVFFRFSQFYYVYYLLYSLFCLMHTLFFLPHGCG